MFTNKLMNGLFSAQSATSKFMAVLAIFSLLMPSLVLAQEASLGFTLNIVNGEIYIVEEGGPYVVYNTDTGVSFGGGGDHDSNEFVGIAGEPGNYAVVGTTGDGVCEDAGFSYSECKSSEYFVSEATFVVTSVNGGQGVAEAKAAATTGDGYALYQDGSSPTVDELTVSLFGTAVGDPYKGQCSDQHVSVDWNEDQDDSSANWENLGGDFTYTCEGGNGGGQSNGSFTDGAWSAEHTYASAGTYTIFVRVHHANPNGNEGSDVSTITIEGVVVGSEDTEALCTDGIDNDDDGLIDSADPDCAEFYPGVNYFPVITILGDNPTTTTQNLPYTDEGATADDFEDGDITGDINTVNPVDTATLGSYEVVYSVSDSVGSTTYATRTVEVIKEVLPPPDYAGYCGDNEVNQEWEQCDGGAFCTEQCLFPVQTQCPNIAFARVNVVDFANLGSGDVSDNLFLGSLTNILPNNTWFPIYNDGAITDPDVDAYEDVPGLALERQDGALRLRMHTSIDEPGIVEQIRGAIELFNASVISQVSDNTGNNKLETPEQSSNPDVISIVDGKSEFAFYANVGDDGFFTNYEFSANECVLDPIGEGFIQGRKYRDVNENNNFDQEEKDADGDVNRLNDWMITLYNTDWVMIDQMLTGDKNSNVNDNHNSGKVGEGQYRFTNLDTGIYNVCEEVKDDWTQLTPADGIKEGIISGATNITTIEDVNNEGLYCYQVTLTEGQEQENVKFGNLETEDVTPVESFDVTGYKFEDENQNGVWDEDESGLEGWEITIAQLVEDDLEIPAINTPIDSVVLEEGMIYLFNSQGTYYANDLIYADAMYSERNASGSWTDTVQNYEGWGPTLLDLQIDGVSPYWGAYTDSHSYWTTVAGAGAPVILSTYDIAGGTNNSGSLMVDTYKVIATTTTAGDGSYSFEDLEAGTYVVRETNQDGWSQTFPTADGSHFVELDSESDLGDINFGNFEEEGYEEPENTPPVIEVLGDNPFELTVGSTFVDPFASSTDAEDGDITNQIATSTDLNINILGTYDFVYSVFDSDGAMAYATRTVNVIEAEATEPEDEGNTGGGSNGGGGSGGSGGGGGCLPGWPCDPNFGSGGNNDGGITNNPTGNGGQGGNNGNGGGFGQGGAGGALAFAGDTTGDFVDEEVAGTTTATTTDEIASTTDNNQLAAVAAAGTLLGLRWWWWILILILLSVIGYYTFRDKEESF